MSRHLAVAIRLGMAGVPALPLRAGKLPVGNCPQCANSPQGRPACGGRPNMKVSGPCTCPRPCHGWAAATADPTVLASAAWASEWRSAAGVAYHPGGANLTVVDLDTAAAVAWARTTLPPTRTVTTTRGEHWLYRGTMRSANAVRPGVDVKSAMQYARWLDHGTGPMVTLPDVVRGLLVKEDTTPARAGLVSSSPARWDRRVAAGCRHTERFVRTGLDRGVTLVRARTTSGAGSQAFGAARFLAAQHSACPGPCALEALGEEIVAAAVSVGVPEDYARRAVTNGLHTPLERAS
ncbi:bifunctional DNA primase/polymerase [Streptomyces sp. NPDC049906]|uniref:bifunctional DNA primase/polymerase n=1 Tax=Streptomyces sp. NPDC049906 TaxID=3155656 RepID=UPI0034283716